MCGIAGSFTVEPRDGDRAALEDALGRLAHRGPDGQGIEAFETSAGRLLLGQRRLAIIDLSDAGLQPMASNDGRFEITFNGEIYNYVEMKAELAALGRRFQTATDTEVLLTAWSEWGSACLTKLDGMFAFALFDRESEELICVRDPFGIKPFYYAHSPGRFAFASEPKAVLALRQRGSRMNRQRAHSFLLWGEYDDGADTFYEEMFQLRPGELLTISLKAGAGIAPAVATWWRPGIAESAIGYDDAVDRVRELFLRSVRRQLRSDVPLGINLSGGIDSSAIACAVRHLEPDFPIHTFSYAADCARLSERKWADMVNSHIGATPHWIDDASGDMVGELDDIIAAQGEPFGGTSIAASYRVFRLARENGVTVTLDGQGADEMLAGYWGYPAAAFRSRLDRGEYRELMRYMRAWKNLPDCSWKQALMQLGDAVVPHRLRDAAFSLAGHSPTPAWLNAERLRASGAEPRAAAPLPQGKEGKGRRLAERLRNALTVNRLPALLRQGDRNSMRWSIESRVPFLNPELANFTLSLPENYLLSPQAETKHIFRQAMRGIVPDAILNRKDKIGFATPEREVLGRDRKRIDSWVDAASEIDFLNADKVRREINRILDGTVAFSFRAWRLINYCRWVSLHEGGLR